MSKVNIISSNKKNTSTKEFLDSKNIEYRIINVDANSSAWEIARNNNIPYNKIVRSKLVSNYLQNFLVVVSIDRIIDYRLLCNNISRKLVTVSASSEDYKQNSTIPKTNSIRSGADTAYKSKDIEIVNEYYNKAIDSYVPIPALFDAIGAIDSSLKLGEEVYFFTENSGELLVIKSESFKNLHLSSSRYDISYPLSKLKLYQEPPGFGDLNVIKGKFSGIRMKSRITETFEIPANFKIVEQIASLKSKETVDEKTLISLVAKDPSITAQVMRWACSPYYKSKGKVSSLEDAVVKVLTPDLVINIAIGLSIGKSLGITEDGILGLKHYWGHSLLAAELVKELGKVVPEEKGVKIGLLSIAGLLHDFGYLVLGHMFQPQFEILRQTLELNRDIGIVKIENYLFQVNHQQLAAWLLGNWNLPKEIITAIEYHHHDDYFGEHSIYPNILFVADNLLKKTFIENGRRGKDIPKELYNNIGITEEQARKVLSKVLKDNSDINKYVDGLFAKEDPIKRANNL